MLPLELAEGANRVEHTGTKDENLGAIVAPLHSDQCPLQPTKTSTTSIWTRRYGSPQGSKADRRAAPMYRAEETDVLVHSGHPIGILVTGSLRPIRTASERGITSFSRKMVVEALAVFVSKKLGCRLHDLCER